MKCTHCGAELPAGTMNFCPECGKAVQTDSVSCKVWPEWKLNPKPLGKGSYGTVYKAVRTAHNFQMDAAIKVISIPTDPAEVASLAAEGMDDQSTRSYFQDIVNDFIGEVQMMESLKGLPNIVSVEDFEVLEKENEIGWDIYIRMELLTPFHTYLSGKTLTEDDVIKLGCDICSALEICDKCNIIHRDIKPENIFINNFGHFKLGDFGIARKMENMTGGLSQKGTPNYMAPEVVSGSKYDARVDIYSLGIVLYRLLNRNRLPFIQGDQQYVSANERRQAVERRLQGERLPAPSDASPRLAQVILKACEFDPNWRFSSATEMKEALLAVKNGISTTTPQLAEMDKTTAVRRPLASNDQTVAVRRASVQDSTLSPAHVYDFSQLTEPAMPTVFEPVLTEIENGTAYGEEDCKTEDEAEIYIFAMDALKSQTEQGYTEAVRLFKRIQGYQDADKRLIEAMDGLEEKRNCQTYLQAVEEMKKESKDGYQEAIRMFQSVPGYRDADEHMNFCKERLENPQPKRKGKALQWIICILLLALLLFVVWRENSKDSTDRTTQNNNRHQVNSTALLNTAGNKTTEAFDEIKTVKVGDYIQFGTYEQDNNTANGKEAVDWLVLDVQDGKALVISKYGLDAKPYNKEKVEVTWKTCTLRNWLNNEFLNEAFSGTEKSKIPTVTVSADKNPSYAADPGNATQDKVFLLSIDEANEYFSSDDARACEPTAYAIAQGAHIGSFIGNCGWWLRSPGYIQFHASNVGLDGSVDDYGDSVDYGDEAVRPALWINLES